MKEPNKLSDKEIVQGIKVLDDKALDQVYDNYKARAIAYIKRVGLSDNEAEEIFQKAIVIFYRKVKKPNFELTSTIYTFLIGITKNLIREFFKKSKREPVTSIEDEPSIDEIEAIPVLNPESERWAFCLEMLKKLGGRCEEILRAFYIKRKSMVEIAVILNEPTEKAGAIKQEKYRCMKKLIRLAEKDPRFTELVYPKKEVND